MKRAMLLTAACGLMFLATGCASRTPASRPMTADDVARLCADRPFLAMGAGDAIGGQMFQQPEMAYARGPVMLETASLERD